MVIEDPPGAVMGAEGVVASIQGTGQIHGDPGDLIQTCVSAAAGPVSLRA
jgi:hypothetical protein